MLRESNKLDPHYVNGFVYIPILRNGSTSIRHLLKRYDCRLVPKECIEPDWLVISVIRDPFERLVSCYHHVFFNSPRFLRTWEFKGIKEVHCFADFVTWMEDNAVVDSEPHLQTQVDKITHEGRLLTQRLFDFKKFSDVANFLVEHGVTESIPHKKKSTYPDYRSFYTDDLWDRVDRIYQADRTLYNAISI